MKSASRLKHKANSESSDDSIRDNNVHKQKNTFRYVPKIIKIDSALDYSNPSRNIDSSCTSRLSNNFKFSYISRFNETLREKFNNRIFKKNTITKDKIAISFRINKNKDMSKCTPEFKKAKIEDFNKTLEYKRSATIIAKRIILDEKKKSSLDKIHDKLRKYELRQRKSVIYI